MASEVQGPVSWKAPWATLHPNQHPSPECFWWSIADLFGSPNLIWCERTLCAIVSQPANTYSNLMYVLCSILMWRDFLRERALRRKRFVDNPGLYSKTSSITGKEGDGGAKGGDVPEMRSVPSSSLIKGFIPVSLLGVFPFLNCAMGLLSLVYHMSNVYPTQVLDYSGMFLVLGWCLAVNLFRASACRVTSVRTTKQFQQFFLVVAAVATHFLYLANIKMQSLVFVGILVIVFFEMRHCRPVDDHLATVIKGDLVKKRLLNRSWFFSSLLLMFLAALCSLSDFKRWYCDPDNHFLQGHALWHLVSGISIYCLWRHYLDRMDPMF
jgi:hypothetical protein